MRDEEDRLKQVARGAGHETARREILGTPVGRRAALVLGLRSAVSLWIMLGSGAALSLFGSLAGCYKAPGTARDQFIYLSPEKEIEMGVKAFRDILRSAPLTANPDVNDLIHRVGRRIADAANKPEYHWATPRAQRRLRPDDRLKHRRHDRGRRTGSRWHGRPALGVVDLDRAADRTGDD